jgi:hypothetical protein
MFKPIRKLNDVNAGGTLACLRLRVQRVNLIEFNLRDFIKALQIRTDDFHTIDLQHSNAKVTTL